MRTVKVLLALLLAGCLLFAALAPVSALSSNEQKWLDRLRPASLPKPKGSSSYPAELQVQQTGGETIILEGTCSLEGQLTDEEIVNAIKQAAAGVDGYGSPDDAIADQEKIADLSGKLKFSKEDQERIINNWIKLVGMDKVVDMFHGKLPSYGKEDALAVLVGMIWSGEAPGIDALSPVPTSMSGFAIGGVINGVVISVDEYKRDQEKWKNIAELANAKARFRSFNGLLNSILKEKMKDKTAWTIRIENERQVEQLYRSSPRIYAPYLYSPDIVLVKKDGNMDDPKGTYEGSFRLKIEVDMSDYDTNFHNYLAESMNEAATKYLPAGAAYTPYVGISQSVNRPSQNRFELGSENVYVSLDKGLGGIFELPLDVQKMDVLDFISLHDMVSVYEQETSATKMTVTWTEIHDTETWTFYHQDHAVIVNKLTGEVTETTNTDDTALPYTDPRSLLQLKLVVDMSDDR